MTEERSHSDFSTDETVLEELAEFEDLLAHTDITPDDFVERRRLTETLSPAQLGQLYPAFCRAYADWLTLQNRKQESRRWRNAAMSTAPQEQNSFGSGPAASYDEKMARLHRKAFGEDYLILRRLGQGGQGYVYLAREKRRTLNRTVALKVLHHTLSDDRFRREVKVATLLEHDNIIRVYDSGERDGWLYYTMPVFQSITVDGPFQGCVTLHDLLRNGQFRRLTMHQVAELMLDVVNALIVLHDPDSQKDFRISGDDDSSGALGAIIHRDVKPENLLLAPAQDRIRVVVTDFGMARESSGSDLTLTETRGFGTRAYMAPEQYEQAKNADARSDVFSCGATFYRLLTGQISLMTDADQSRHKNESSLWIDEPRQALPARELNRKIDVQLEAILAKCLSISADERYQSAQELKDDLERLLRGQSVGAPTHRLWERWWNRLQRNRKSLLAATLLITLSLMTIGAGWYGFIRPPEVVRKEVTVSPDFVVDVAEHLQSASTALDNGDVAAAFNEVSTVPVETGGWARSCLLGKIQSASSSGSILTEHDWGTTDLLYADDGPLISAGLDERLVTTTIANGDVHELNSGVWIENPGQWRPAFERSDDSLRLRDESECVTRLAWIDPNQSFAAALWGGRGEVWEKQDQGAYERRTVIADHPRPLTAVAVSSDGLRICFGDLDGQLLLSLQSGKVITSNLFQGSGILSLTSLPGGSWVVGCNDGRLALLDNDLKSVTDERTLTGPIYDARASADGQLLATTAGAEVRVWDVADGARFLGRGLSLPALSKNRAQSVHMQTVAFVNDERIAASDADGRLFLWDATTGSLQYHELVVGSGFLHGEQGRLPLVFQRTIGAIRFDPSRNVLWLAGRDGLVQSWHLGESDPSTIILTPAGTFVSFHPQSSELLVTVSPERTVSIRSTGADRPVSQKQISGQGRVSGLIPVGSTHRFLIFDDTGQVFEIHVDEQGQLEISDSPLLSHNTPIAACAATTDGSSVVLYDMANQIVVWDRTTEMVRAKTDVSRSDSLIHSRVVAISPDNQRLAVSGEGQSVLILDALTLDVLQTPSLAAGLGATHLGWAGQDGEILFVGDSEGTVRAMSLTRSEFSGTSDGALGSRLADLVVTPDRTQVLAVSETGLVRCFDADDGRMLCDISPPAAMQNKPRCWTASIGSQGKRLAVASIDGTVVVEGGAQERKVSPATTERSWIQRVVWSDDETSELWSRTAAVALDQDDQICCLFSTRTASQLDESLWFGCDQNGEFQTTLVDRISLSNLSKHTDFARSVSLSNIDGTVWGAYRRRRPEQGAYVGTLKGFRIHRSGGRELETWFPEAVPGNAGFENQILSIADEPPTVLCFDHGSHGLLKYSPSTVDQTLKRVGRQGDGMYFHAVAADALHIVSRVNRFNADPPRVLYHRIETSGSGTEEVREYVDRHRGSRVHSIDVDAEGNPVVLLTRPTSHRLLEVIVARRHGSRWHQQRLPMSAPRGVAPSNLSVSQDGVLLFVFLDDAGRLLMASVTEADSNLEVIADHPLSSDRPLSTLTMIALRGTSDGRPVVVTTASGPNGSTIETYSPE